MYQVFPLGWILVLLHFEKKKAQIYKTLFFV